MATIESLKGTITKAQTALTEGVKNSEDAANSLEVRKLKKKVKRLTRKSSKFVAFDKMAEEKKKPKKDREKKEE
jgi:hypothetical protein